MPVMLNAESIIEKDESFPSTTQIVKHTVIALPSDVHEKLPTIKGSYNGTAKELLQFTKNQLIDAGVPSDIVNNYIDYVKIKYPNNIW